MTFGRLIPESFRPTTFESGSLLFFKVSAYTSRMLTCLLFVHFFQDMNARADQIQNASEKPLQFQKLQTKKAQTFHFSSDEADSIRREAIEGFENDYKLSDPETQAALDKAMVNVSMKADCTTKAVDSHSNKKCEVNSPTPVPLNH